MIPSCGAEVMLVPLIESESTEGEKKTMFQDEWYDELIRYTYVVWVEIVDYL